MFLGDTRSLLLALVLFIIQWQQRHRQIGLNTLYDAKMPGVIIPIVHFVINRLALHIIHRGSLIKN